MSFQNKYLKYKKKYLYLKNQFGDGNDRLKFDEDEMEKDISYKTYDVDKKN